MHKSLSTLVILSIYVVQLSAQASKDWDFGFQLGLGPSIAQVNDKNGAPSRSDLSADGETTVAENRLHGRNIKLMVSYELDEYYSISSGLYFGQRRMNLLNVDGTYYGTSTYHANYVHIPVLLRYSSNELRDYLNLIVMVGPTIDIKTKESTNGADYAHFMNFARNNIYQDPERGRNGNYQSMDLFSKVGLSLFLSVGLQYRLTDAFSIYAGLAYHQSITNMLNSELVYNDPEKTSIADELKIRTALIAFEFGVGFNFASDNQ